MWWVEARHCENRVAKKRTIFDQRKKESDFGVHSKSLDTKIGDICVVKLIQKKTKKMHED